jgi:hypothetical protein
MLESLRHGRSSRSSGFEERIAPFALEEPEDLGIHGGVSR